MTGKPLPTDRYLALAMLFSIFLLLSMNGCAQTHQARDVKVSGFLQDYSKLQPGNKDEALLVYRNPDRNFSHYKKVFVDPVFIWKAKSTQGDEVVQEDFQRLAEELRSKVIWQIKDDYLVIPALEPGVMRLQIALTEAVTSNVGFDVLSTFLPGAGAYATMTELATGTRAFVGRASVEGKISDSTTGELLFAAVDRRIGSRSMDGVMDSWDDVHQAFDYWAKRLGERLTDRQSQESVERP